jgi:hypothetical protein
MTRRKDSGIPAAWKEAFGEDQDWFRGLVQTLGAIGHGQRQVEAGSVSGQARPAECRQGADQSAWTRMRRSMEKAFAFADPGT